MWHSAVTTSPGGPPAPGVDSMIHRTLPSLAGVLTAISWRRWAIASGPSLPCRSERCTSAARCFTNSSKQPCNGTTSRSPWSGTLCHMLVCGTKDSSPAQLPFQIVCYINQKNKLCGRVLFGVVLGSTTYYVLRTFEGTVGPFPISFPQHPVQFHPTAPPASWIN